MLELGRVGVLPPRPAGTLELRSETYECKTGNCITCWEDGGPMTRVGDVAISNRARLCYINGSSKRKANRLRRFQYGVAKSHDRKCGCCARNPLFTLTAVVTIALGLGATTAIFSVTNGVLLLAFALQRPGSPGDRQRRSAAAPCFVTTPYSNADFIRSEGRHEERVLRTSPAFSHSATPFPGKMVRRSRLLWRSPPRISSG